VGAGGGWRRNGGGRMGEVGGGGGGGGGWGGVGGRFGVEQLGYVRDGVGVGGDGGGGGGGIREKNFPGRHQSVPRVVDQRFPGGEGWSGGSGKNGRRLVLSVGAGVCEGGRSRSGGHCDTIG